MHPILRTPEIVLIILSSLPAADAIHAASVCRLWSDLAADSIWRTLPSLAPLLNILAPMEYEADKAQWVSIF